jgi:hypothetical protein
MDYVIYAAIAILIPIAAILGIQNIRLADAKREAMSPQEWEDHLKQKRAASELQRQRRQERSDSWAYGDINAAMICPHCNTKGQIRTKVVENKRGVSGGKATAAILTGGVSLLVTGLSRKEEATQARCGNCSNLWSF